VRYPDDVEQLNQRYDAESAAATEIDGKFAEYPAALDNPDWALVNGLYERANQEGQSSAYVEQQREETLLARFHTEERKPLVRRIAASNEYVAKEKGCEVELWGASDRGLEKGLEERVEARRRANSDAHAEIERQKDALGKKNEAVLRQQVDEIRFASYVVNVGLLLEQEEMQRKVDEAGAAKDTLEEHIEKLKQEPKPNPEEIARAEAALKKIDAAVETAKQRLSAAEQRGQELKQKHDDAFKQLQDAVEAAEEAQPEAAAKK
jgi:hypothetical protein